ncbi:unnamed protein product [Adineta steineri]|uniref:EB domain-containing protein n=1 Tax=Adineta steineri TaxID=433720 RepID=A0A815MW52_9BILA|nr:unnamed protein product [Adineta steineri]CAF1430107.1 unnamed protein product [Adineta steineri]CAF1624019.1 unnamed protein product [Adineta steineri]CAF1624050.1 unnamed protein product [Adineta steineri]
MTIDNRTLSMTIPYSLNNNHEQENLFVQILTRHISEKPFIRFNLNMIQCLENQSLNWTSVESSLTLRGEFVRTVFTDTNIMYLSSGLTYLRNLTSIDCLTKTLYRTDKNELFQVNFKIESTLNDFCSDEHLCYPLNIYQCNHEQHRCICRSPLQSYLTKDQQLICIHAVKNIDQCTIENVRCLEWCHLNSSSTVCTCPKDLAIKKYLNDERAYCEGQKNGICDSFIQCPLGDICTHGTCQNSDNRLRNILSLDIITISIIVASLILFVIIIILVVSMYLLRRHRWKKHYHSSIDRVYKKKRQQTNIPTTSDYDNVIYGVFRNNVQVSSRIVSSNDDTITDSSPFTTSDSTSYHPKIVFLGGEQQLTAIYA